MKINGTIPAWLQVAGSCAALVIAGVIAWQSVKAQTETNAATGEANKTKIEAIEPRLNTIEVRQGVIISKQQSESKLQEERYNTNSKQLDRILDKLDELE